MEPHKQAAQALRNPGSHYGGSAKMARDQVRWHVGRRCECVVHATQHCRYRFGGGAVKSWIGVQMGYGGIEGVNISLSSRYKESRRRDSEPCAQSRERREVRLRTGFHARERAEGDASIIRRLAQ